MNLLRFFRAINPIVLAVVVLTMTSTLEVEHSFVMAADRPAKEHGKAEDDHKQADANRGEVREPGAPKQEKEAKEPKAEKGSGEEKEEKDTSGKEDEPKQSRPSGETETNPHDQPPLASATAETKVTIGAISVDDPCRVSGTVSLSGAYFGSLTLGLTYHVTASGEFVSSGSTWSHEFGGQTSAVFQLTPGPPQDFQAGPGERINSYRVELVSASPEVSNMMVKSDSFYCGEEGVEPGPSATPIPTFEPPVTATPIDTPDPSPSSTPSPTSSPSPTATGTPTATSVPVPTATATVTPSPTPTMTPSATPTSTAVATPGGATKISPDNAGSANPGATAVYMHTVHNLSLVPDIKEITVVSSQGWHVGLFAEDGATPLVDSNRSGSVDTGRIGAGQSKEIVVKVTVPPEAMRGVTDVATVTAKSAGNPIAPNTDTATNTTTVNGVISISLSTSTVDFGRISPSGARDPDAVGVWSTVDELGAYYVKDRSVQVTVSSNSAWTGTVSALENAGDANSIRIADGDLQWRFDGDTNWAALTLSSSTFAEGSPGSSVQSYDYRLRILWEDDPGDFRSAVTYQVTQ